MNHVLVLEGSPRKGNTSAVTDWVLAGMGKGNKVTRVKLCELDIHPCQACLACTKTKGAPGCAQGDDMTELYDKMIDADLVLWTSPIYCWSVTARVKSALERCFALLTGEGLLKGSKWALVLTAGGDAFDGADLAVQVFARFSRYAGIEYLGQHVAAPCPDGAKLAASAALRSSARGFGKELAKALRAK
ncbi:flavodoxin family protein [candidate division WOR-3 bacterium]|uniref:Flavodoxin family protein n=1 Tax=candidate division WOR-3 bacterium TaxID=2052148 RepID=A0A937XFB9_UNCW3|nr:flavodoxin family protein [candidate division WOR-3 bacterium]